jgi:hypothetical protein
MQRRFFDKVSNLRKNLYFCQKIRNMKQYSWLFSLIIIVISLAACTKDNLPVITNDRYDIEILVTDDRNRPLRDIPLKFYRTEADMRTDLNAVEGYENAKTDAQGKYRILSYDLGQVDFFFSAEYEKQNNWDSLFRVRAAQIGEPVKFRTIIKETINNTLAGRSSRQWQQKSFKINGIETLSCVYRQIWEFQRIGRALLFYNTTEFCGNDRLAARSTWQIAPDNKTVELITTGTSLPQKMTFTVLNATTMKFFTTNTNPANGQVFVSEYEFSAVK